MVHSSGRPRKAQLDAALQTAAEALIVSKGYGAMSVDAVAAAAGTTRPAFYRRYSGIPDLVLSLILQKFGVDLDFNSGELRTDLVNVQRDQVALFSDPLVSNSLAGFLESTRHNEDLASMFVGGFLGPRRAATGAILHRAAARGDIPTGYEMDWVCDLLTGPLLLRAIMPGLPSLDEDLVQHTVETALRALRYPTA
ncbi:TetR/AcrR family transcriptional regulator [Paenarthrobacter sp. PH39-S1]|uniref:TetR/AcrR family transcriptional regulator n=1 Tax=Paenarthrobacter sp. PH39-S1 TaxID=3046204 RepID=UPI0024BB90EF|nr:TetR/AcrR family transcriptional regulator [Paenarthrobacter sp. PH39-S1]MDJ0356856.1 TetR/AcrR family transcriptional regulator [Paenarthrobacter sp. PH39-S1]